MSLSENHGKIEIIKDCRRHEKDTGSPEVQIGLLTKRLDLLSKHFERHPQDKHSLRGLLEIVSRRKRLLNHLRNEDISRYREALTKFGLRK
jgi:small subunit ribosomal protein S15